MTNINVFMLPVANNDTSMLPVVKSAWQSQLAALKAASESTARVVLNLTKDVASDSSLKPQLEKAQLAQWQANQKYNAFVDSGTQLLKVATDADARLKSRAAIASIDTSQGVLISPLFLGVPITRLQPLRETDPVSCSKLSDNPPTGKEAA